MSIFSFSRKAVDRLSYFLANVAMWGVFALMLLIVTDVAMRALFKRSTLIAEEAGGYLLVLIAYLAMAEALKQGKHVRVEIITGRLPGRLRIWLDVVLYPIGLAALILVIWRVVIMVRGSYTGGVIIPGVFLTPVYIPQILVVIGLTALALQGIADLSKTLYTLRKTYTDSDMLMPGEGAAQAPLIESSAKINEGVSQK